MVVRGSVRRCVLAGADLLLVVTHLMIDLVVVVRVDLAAESHSRMTSHLAVLHLIHGSDGGLRDEHGRQRHAQRGEERPQLRGSQS